MKFDWIQSLLGVSRQSMSSVHRFISMRDLQQTGKASSSSEFRKTSIWKYSQRFRDLLNNTKAFDSGLSWPLIASQSDRPGRTIPIETLDRDSAGTKRGGRWTDDQPQRRREGHREKPKNPPCAAWSCTCLANGRRDLNSISCLASAPRTPSRRGKSWSNPQPRALSRPEVLVLTQIASKPCSPGQGVSVCWRVTIPRRWASFKRESPQFVHDSQRRTTILPPCMVFFLRSLSVEVGDQVRPQLGRKEDGGTYHGCFCSCLRYWLNECLLSLCERVFAFSSNVFARWRRDRAWSCEWAPQRRPTARPLPMSTDCFARLKMDRNLQNWEDRSRSSSYRSVFFHCRERHRFTQLLLSATWHAGIRQPNSSSSVSKRPASWNRRTIPSFSQWTLCELCCSAVADVWKVNFGFLGCSRKAQQITEASVLEGFL